MNMVKAPSFDKLNLKRGLWTAEEDAKILAYVSKHGTSNWTSAPKKAGLRRCGKSCRLRWTNYLRPDLKHDSFTPQEEEMIIRLHAAIGSRWSIIAQQLPGRTDNDVKNYWNTKLRKKLSEMGIDPVTHKPFSQILADYGNIGGLPNTTKRIGSISRDLKSAIMIKPEQYSNSVHGHGHKYHDIIDIADLLPPVTPLPESEAIPNKFMNGNIHQFTEAPNGEQNQTHTQVQGSTSGYSWRDFLLDDAFVPSEPQEEENEIEIRKGVYESEMKFAYKSNDIEPTPSSSSSSSSSSSCGENESSFIETLLDQDNNSFLDFLHLLEEPFHD